MHRDHAPFIVRAGLLVLVLALYLGATGAAPQAEAVTNVGVFSPAGVADPSKSTTPGTLWDEVPWIAAIRDQAYNPVQGARVSIHFDSLSYNACSTAVCPGCTWNAEAHELVALTNAMGEATFTTHSGGYSGFPFIAAVVVDNVLFPAVTCVAAPKHYTFKIYVNHDSPTGHAFVELSDGTLFGTLRYGFHPKPGFLNLIDIIETQHVEAEIRDDSAYVANHTAAIEWTVTAAQYAAVIQRMNGIRAEIEAGTLKYNVLTRMGMLNCMKYCMELAAAAGIAVPDPTKYGRLPASAGVPDPVGLERTLQWKLANGVPWDSATISTGPGCATACHGDTLTTMSVFIDAAIEVPNELAEWYAPPLGVEMMDMGSRFAAPGQALTYSNPVSWEGPALVFWAFGDAYQGVIGSPLDSTQNEHVSHTFSETGTYAGTLVVVTTTTLYHCGFTTVVYAGAGADPPPVELVLRAVGPNPTRGGALTVCFTLPSGTAASLELLDVAGRRIAAREVGSLGAGQHTLDLGEGQHLAPGLYLVRLTQGANTRVKRVVVLK